MICVPCVRHGDRLKPEAVAVAGGESMCARHLAEHMTVTRRRTERGEIGHLYSDKPLHPPAGPSGVSPSADGSR